MGATMHPEPLEERSVGELRPGDHAWLLYDGEEERDHVLNAFVGGDGPVVWVGDEAPAGIEPLTHDEACRVRGRFDPGHLYTILRRRVAAARREAKAAGNDSPVIRVTMDLTWTLTEEGGPESLLRCERALDEALPASADVIALCRLDHRCCPDTLLGPIRARHRLMARPDPEFADSVLRILPTFRPPGLAVGGEIDSSRHFALTRVLSRAGRKSGPELHLDLADLRFIDFGGLSLLAEFARSEARSRTLVLDHVPDPLRSVMDLVGWGGLPGMRLGDELLGGGV